MRALVRSLKLVADSPTDGSFVYDGTHYFVTNSHCMQAPYVTNTQFEQGPVYDGNVIGWEERQPPWDNATYANCPQGYGCSLADAALVGYVYGNGAMAQIARTSQPNDGSTTIDQFQPVFIIEDSTQDSGSQITGTLVSKIGKTSRWTTGTTSGSCFNQPAYFSGYMLLCQDQYSALAEEGDSGSPVFKVDFSGMYATMVGLHWGGNETGGAFSPYVYVRYELTRADYNQVCGSIWQCWLGLNVSGSWH